MYDEHVKTYAVHLWCPELDRLIEAFPFDRFMAVDATYDRTRIYQERIEEYEELVDGLIAAALPVPHEIACAAWIRRVRQQSDCTVLAREFLAHDFPRRLRRARDEQKRMDAKLRAMELVRDDVRIPKVFHVPIEAGRTPVGTGWSKARENYVAGYDQKTYAHEINEGVRLVTALVNWLDRDEGTAMDMCQFMDYHTRAADSQVDSKRTYLKKIHAEMRDLERNAKADSEFDEEAWKRLNRTRERIIMSGKMLADLLTVFHIVRGNTYSRTGRSMSSFRSWKQMKVDKDQYHKLKIQTIEADKLVGLTPEEYAVWKKLTRPELEPEPGEFADEHPTSDGIGGVNALPDERTAGSEKDVLNAKERFRRQDQKHQKALAGYTRSTRSAVPKKGVGTKEIVDLSEEVHTRIRAKKA